VPAVSERLARETADGYAVFVQRVHAAVRAGRVKSPADQLREEFGITEERGNRGARVSSGQRLCTAGEWRALVCGLRLSGKQVAARFGVPMGTLNWWGRMPTGHVLHVARPEVHAKLLPVVQRAQELGLLAKAPKPLAGTDPKPLAGTDRKTRVPRTGPRNDTKPPRAPYVPRATLKRFRCAACGLELRQSEVQTDRRGDLFHDLPGNQGGCGPVRAADVTGAA